MNLEEIDRYRSRGVLVDSNLLLVLCVGYIDRNLVPGFNRTRRYTAKDYDLLCALLNRFKKILTTPNIMTEVNNLGRHLTEEHKAKFQKIFGHMANDVLEEQYLESRAAVKVPLFRDYGLADSVAFSVVQNGDGCLLLTDDLQLAARAEKNGAAALNFNHVRYLSLD